MTAGAVAFDYLQHEVAFFAAHSRAVMSRDQVQPLL